jgi:uncharacterized protein
MPNNTYYQLKEQQLCLIPQKAIWWEEERMLLLADVHLGKVGHFRKAGIPIPTQIHQEDLKTMSDLIAAYQPDSLTILGDLFHSNWNTDWYLFEDWLAQHPHLQINLVKGNHDIIPESFFIKHQISVFPETWEKAPFVFSHIPLEIKDLKKEYYNLCGHLHPAVSLNGKGKQHLRLACFYFGEQQGYLPAFGKFTGTATIQAKQGDEIFVVVEDKVLKIT